MSALPQIVEPQSYEDCVSAAITEREKKDRSQWRIGDLTTRALGKTVSGHNSGLSDFAKEIGLDASTVSDYKSVSEFFPAMHRHRFPNMSYTHYRTAWRANRESLHEALAWLDRASGEGWSVEALRLELRKDSEKPEPQEMTLQEALMRFGAQTVVTVKDLESVIRLDIKKPA